MHRVYRVPGFLSSRPNWVPPHPQAIVAAPFGSKKEEPLACCGGGGGDPILKKVDTLHNTTYIPLQFRGSGPNTIFLERGFILPFKEVIFSST